MLQNFYKDTKDQVSPPTRVSEDISLKTKTLKSNSTHSDKKILLNGSRVSSSYKRGLFCNIKRDRLKLNIFICFTVLQITLHERLEKEKERQRISNDLFITPMESDRNWEFVSKFFGQRRTNKFFLRTR